MILILIITLISIFNNEPNNKYLNYGPNNDLIILGIKIDNYIKYIILNIVIGII